MNWTCHKCGSRQSIYADHKVEWCLGRQEQIKVLARAALSPQEKPKPADGTDAQDAQNDFQASTKPEHRNELREILREFANGKDWRHVPTAREDEALAAINARFEAALGEDEDVYHQNPYGRAINVDGKHGDTRNQLRAEARKRWYGDTKGGSNG